MNSFVYSVLLFFSTLAHAEVSYLNRDTIYENSFANPRSLASGLTFGMKDFEASIGDELSIARVKIGQLYLESAIEAAAWFTLDYRRDVAFALKTEDYFFAFPLAARYENLALVFKYNHLSAHLGDGARHRERRIYSRDYLTTTLSFDSHLGDQIYFICHLTGGYMFIVHPEYVEPLFFAAGWKIEWGKTNLKAFIAIDYDTRWQFVPSGVTAHVGLKISDNLFISCYTYSGEDYRGQNIGRQLRTTGLALRFI